MEWISVKERLPENEDYVLLCDAYLGTIPTVGWYERNEDGKEGFFTMDHCLRLRLIITHWMPLPGIPNEVDKH